MKLLQLVAAGAAMPLLASVAAGCGKSGASTGDPGVQAIAYAKSVNLRPSDVRPLVGSTVALRRKTRYGPYGTLGERCAGGDTHPGDVFGILSERFVHRRELSKGEFPEEDVFSAVYVLPSDALASHEAAVLASARARACLGRLDFGQGARVRQKGEPVYSKVQIAPLALPAGTGSAQGHRVKAVLGAFLQAPREKGRPNYYQDFLGFAVGRAVITLHTAGAPRPFPSATEKRLLSLLRERAQANESILGG